MKTVERGVWGYCPLHQIRHIVKESCPVFYCYLHEKPFRTRRGYDNHRARVKHDD